MTDERESNATSACLSDFMLDQYLAAELAPEARAQAQAHLDGCASCRERIETIEAESAAFLSVAPSLRAHAAFVAETKAAQRTIARNHKVMAASSVLALAAMVSLAVMSQRATEQTRLKGSAHVDFFLKRGASVSQGVSGDVLLPGDQLRFAYTSPTDASFALIHVDQDDATVYFPSTGESSATIRRGAKQPLDFGVELDAEIGDEHVYGIFCDKPFKLADAIKRVSAAQPIAPEGCQLDVIQLKKRRAP